MKYHYIPSHMTMYCVTHVTIFYLLFGHILQTTAVMIDLNRSPPPSPSDSMENPVTNDDKQPIKVTWQTPKRKRSRPKKIIKTNKVWGTKDNENESNKVAKSTLRRRRMLARMTVEEKEKFYKRKRKNEKKLHEKYSAEGNYKKYAKDTERRRQRISKMTNEEREIYYKKKREREKEQYQRRKALLGYGRNKNESLKIMRRKMK